MIEINMLLNRSIICQGLGDCSQCIIDDETLDTLLIVTWLFLNTLIIGKHEHTFVVLQDDFGVVVCLKEKH